MAGYNTYGAYLEIKLILKDCILSGCRRKVSCPCTMSCHISYFCLVSLHVFTVLLSDSWLTDYQCQWRQSKFMFFREQANNGRAEGNMRVKQRLISLHKCVAKPEFW